MSTELVRYDKVHQSLSAGIVKLKETIGALDLKAENAKFAIQKLVVQAQEARDIAKDRRDREAAAFVGPLNEIRERWKPLINGFDELFSDLKKIGGQVLASERQTTGSDVKGVKTESGTLSGTEIWKWEVEDLVKVPEEYMITIVDVNKVFEAIKRGVREIPGIRIFSETQMVSRRRKSS